jgi:hypothetical protein
LFKENEMYLSDLQGRINVENILVSGYKRLQDSIVDKSKLVTGDLLLSFKTNEFLKNVIISKKIAKVTGSHVTHILVAVKLPMSDPRVIDSDRAFGGVTLRDLNIRKGEVLLVLRPRLNSTQRVELLKHLKYHVQNRTTYPVPKMIGVWPSTILSSFAGLFTGRYHHVQNVLAIRNAGFFCSEFLDNAFKQAGFMLTPKSRYSEMVAPADIAASPNVEYIGLLFNPSEDSRKIIEKDMEGMKL